MHYHKCPLQGSFLVNLSQIQLTLKIYKNACVYKNQTITIIKPIMHINTCQYKYA